MAACGLVYGRNEGFLACYDAATGEQVYKSRLASGGMVTASPVLVGERLLILSETGKAQWIKAGRKFEVWGAGDIGDTFWASPAVVGDRVYLRGVEALYCLKEGRHRAASWNGSRTRSSSLLQTEIFVRCSPFGE